MSTEKGFSLVEVLVALAIVSILAVGFMSALATSSRAAVSTDEKDTARVLAESQLEYIREQLFAASYTPQTIPAGHPGYSANIIAVPATQRDSFVQKITVTISRNSVPVMVLEGYKARR